jgi:DNA-binding NarL/FixJ family response regulator
VKFVFINGDCNALHSNVDIACFTRYCITQNIKKSAESVFLSEFLYVILYTLLLLSKKEKEKLVIELATEGKTTREIAKQVHISEGYRQDYSQSDRL